MTEQDFETAVRDYAIQIDFKENLIQEFLGHWCAVSEGGRKMHWQKQETFDIRRRMQQWQRNFEKWNKVAVNVMPNYYDKNYEYKLEKEKGINEVMKYHKHLIAHGWKKLHGPGGTSWVKPVKT